MSRYLWINLVSWSVPFLYSFVPPVRFYRKIPQVVLTFLGVGGGFIAWDIWATRRGDWGFSPAYLSGREAFGLPVEEILFFFFIPYACLFTHAHLAHYLPERRIRFPRFVNAALACLLASGSLIFWNQDYTRTVLISCALFFAVTLLWQHDLLESRTFWIYLGVTYVPFFIVNYLLTSPPVVWYNPEAIWGPRITTIPLEDFFYSFSMLSFYLLVFRFLQDRWARPGFSGLKRGKD
jgi:lycopene cyclase domain-containing protein